MNFRGTYGPVEKGAHQNARALEQCLATTLLQAAISQL